MDSKVRLPVYLMGHAQSIQHEVRDMRLVLDVENSVTWRDGKILNDPFEAGNTLTQIGLVNADNHEELHIVTFDHNEKKDTSGAGHKLVQQVLDMTELLIMHNGSHDLMWIWEAGFKYDGAIWDTLLAEYLLHRGVEKPLSLAAVAEARGLAEQKEDYLSKCIKQGINTNETDLHSLREIMLRLTEVVRTKNFIEWLFTEFYICWVLKTRLRQKARSCVKKKTRCYRH